MLRPLYKPLPSQRSPEVYFEIKKWRGEHYDTLVDQNEGTFPFHFFIASTIFRFPKKNVNKKLNLTCFVSGETLSYKYIKST